MTFTGLNQKSSIFPVVNKCIEWGAMEQERCHTNKVVPHLVQNWLHVLLSQILRSHQAFQHPKHSPKTTLLSSAEKHTQNHYLRIQTKTHSAAAEIQCWKNRIEILKCYPFLLVSGTTTLSSSTSSSSSSSEDS